MHNGEAEILNRQNQQQIDKEPDLQKLIAKALKSFTNLNSPTGSKKGKKRERKSSRRRNNGRKCINKATENEEIYLGKPLTSPPPTAGCSTRVDTKGRKKSSTSVSALPVQSSTEPVSELNRTLEVGTSPKTSENENTLEEMSQSTGTGSEEIEVILKRNTHLKVGSAEKEETRNMPVSEKYASLEQRFKTMQKNVLRVFHYIVPDFSLGEEQDIENILSTMNQIISAQEEESAALNIEIVNICRKDVS